MSQIELADDLRDELKAILAPLKNFVSLNCLVEEPLRKIRRGLADEAVHDRPWTLLPMMVCEAICHKHEHAIPAAAAIQIFLAAGDVFDDIEDADSSDSLSAKYGSALATNTATTLLILAEKAITRLKQRNVRDFTIVRILDEVNSCFISACIGQHEDLRLSTITAIPEDTYLKILGLKSASQIECACRIGAILADTTQPMIDAFSLFGWNLGMAAQISNDIQGITQGADILKKKITLPIIFAFSQTENEICTQLKRIFFEECKSERDEDEIRDLLFRIGSIHYATVKMEYYKQCALDCLKETQELGASIADLKVFFD